MGNKNYPVIPDGNQKVAPVKRKDMQEALLDVNESIDKLNGMLAELNSKYSDLRMDGLKLVINGPSKDLIDSMMRRTHELPGLVEKAVVLGLKKSINDLDAEISRIKNYCVIGTVIINVLFAIMALSLLV